MSQAVAERSRAPRRRAAHRHAALDTPVLLAGCLALAALSLAAPAPLGGHLPMGYDPWGWSIWGREVLQLRLDTTGSPSWKPLPVLFTTLFAPFGDAAPALWLATARAGGLLGLAMTYRLARRLAGPAAGVLAALALLLTPDVESRWIRHVAQGNVEPLLIALCLWAVERWLDGRRDHAVVLLTLAALARPEVWPFLGLAGVLVWRRDPSRRWLVALLPTRCPYDIAWIAVAVLLLAAGVVLLRRAPR